MRKSWEEFRKVLIQKGNISPEDFYWMDRMRKAYCQGGIDAINAISNEAMNKVSLEGGGAYVEGIVSGLKEAMISGFPRD
jgi:hypothetical protein